MLRIRVRYERGLRVLFRLGVFATTTDERGWVPLCHRTACDYWNQLGGELESGETPWDGIVREVREETGLRG